MMIRFEGQFIISILFLVNEPEFPGEMSIRYGKGHRIDDHAVFAE